MELSPGTNLSHYRIMSRIGAGGMGEVYLAEDTRLHRRVALKVLPLDVAANQDRMRRFHQEATSAAALNHPNIAHIYEIGEGQGTHFIAMEYVEGHTLREEMREQPELRKLLRYLQHAAEGLAKAHAAGIIHRDLKPDNIMITADGHAKILDFGLAKLLEPQKLSSTSSEMATAIMPHESQPGTVLGTVGYMSPEQAQGKSKEIDNRSDIFSFGCILYEVATGRKPFEGKDTIDTLNKIIREPAAPISSINPDAPADLQRIVRRCLAKDPEERYQTIKDVAIEIKEVRRDIRSAASTEIFTSQTGSDLTSRPSGPTISGPSSAAVSNTAAPSLSTRASSAEYVAGQIKGHRTGVVIGVVLVVLILGGGVFGIYKLVKSRPAAGSSFASMRIEKLTDTGKAGSVAISPDGKIVVHVVEDAGQQSLWVRHIATGSNVQIIPPAEVIYGRMTFSADGNYIYFVRGGKDDFSGSLYSMPVFGGEARKLVDDVASSITFSPDGKRLAFVRFHPIKDENYLVMADVDGGNQRTLATLKGDDRFGGSGPAWSPDGSVIATGCAKDEGSVHQYLATVNVADGAIKPISSQQWDDVGRVGWLADGSGLVAALYEKGAKNSQYYLVSYPEGVARRITNDVNDYHDLSLTADTSTLATVQEDRIINVWTASGGDAKSLRQLTFGSGKYEGASGVCWTPDGHIIHDSWSGNAGDIWISNADGSGARRLTDTPSPFASWFPAVSPDGRYVVFISDRAGKNHMWRMDLDGGNLKQLTSGNKFEREPAFSPDGRWLYYADYDGEHLDIFRLPVEGGQATQITEGFLCDTPIISPDGKTIAAYYREHGGAPLKIVLLPFDGGKPIKIFDAPQNPTNIKWTPDGRSILYGDTQKGVTNIWALPLDGGKARQVTDFNSGQINWFDIDRSGKPTLFSRGEIRKDVVLITGFR